MVLSDDYYKYIVDDMKKDTNKRGEINQKLADLYKGKLKTHIDDRIATEFKKEENIIEISNRTLKINIAKRVADKIAIAYKEDPMRSLQKENSNDQEILDHYLTAMDFNEIGSIIDRYTALHKECLVWAYFNEKNMVPSLKVLRPWQYKVYSLDKQDDEATDVIAIPDKFGREDIIKIYSNDWITILDSEGRIRRDIMATMGNDLGINPYGKLPFVYVRNERDMAMTYPDEAFLDISLFIPILFGDLNYAIKYQAFGMIWGRNVNAELINRSPNAFLNLLPADIDSQVTPEVGVVKPQIDISESLETAVKQLALWLNSRGLRPSSISAQVDVGASGISKMIDEADVTQIVSKNQNMYKKYERELFDFILKNGHPIWAKETRAIPKTLFSAGNSVITNFIEPKPFVSIDEIIDRQNKLINAGLITKEFALKTIYPEFKDEKIDEMIIKATEEQKALLQAQSFSRGGF